MAKALLEDPTIFDYDSHYKVAESRQKKNLPRPSSRYIDRLMKANEVRQIEQTAAWDKMESKQARRDGKGSDEQAFITNSYVNQLEI